MELQEMENMPLKEWTIGMAVLTVILTLVIVVLMW